jgi:hypothetical protein
MPVTYDEAKRELFEAISKNIQRGSDVAAGLDKTLISLSGGALVFSMTFVNTLAPSKLALPALFGAWVAFSTSIVAVLYSMRSLQSGLLKTFDEIMNRINALEEAEREGASQISIPTKSIRYANVEFLNRAGIGAFIVGILLLGFFVAYNIWFGQAR